MCDILCTCCKLDRRETERELHLLKQQMYDINLFFVEGFCMLKKNDALSFHYAGVQITFEKLGCS